MLRLLLQGSEIRISFPRLALITAATWGLRERIKARQVRVRAVQEPFASVVYCPVNHTT
jgi:hypothetical protein